MRRYSSDTEVKRATTSYSLALNSSWRATALSFPPLHDMTTGSFITESRPWSLDRGSRVRCRGIDRRPPPAAPRRYRHVETRFDWRDEANRPMGNAHTSGAPSREKLGHVPFRAGFLAPGSSPSSVYLPRAIHAQVAVPLSAPSEAARRLQWRGRAGVATCFPFHPHDEGTLKGRTTIEPSYYTSGPGVKTA